MAIHTIFKFGSILLLLTYCKSQNNTQKALTTEQQNTIQQAKNNFVFVEGGTFVIGNRNFMESSPEQQVTLSSYSISKYETTFKEFDMYTEVNKLDSIAPRWRNQEDMGQNFGAIAITWQQAKDYCKWLGKQLKLPIDLPTDAQWEYAARSRGLKVEHATNNGKIEGSYTSPYNYGTRDEVGTYPPNPLGLYDMSGGRGEWVRDWFYIFPSTPVTNPVQDTIGISKKKIVRGVHTLTSSIYRRTRRKPSNDGAGVGFRCACYQETPIN